MREGNIFSLFTLAGGVPHLRSRRGRGGTSSQVQTGGYPIPGPILILDGVPPISRMGYPSICTWDGVPHSADGGYPIQDEDGRVPPPQQNWYPSPGPDLGWGLSWGTPIQDWMGYPPSRPGMGGIPSIQD